MSVTNRPESVPISTEPTPTDLLPAAAQHDYEIARAISILAGACYRHHSHLGGLESCTLFKLWDERRLGRAFDAPVLVFKEKS